MADFEIINADVMDGLATLADASVQVVVTSPPYFALRSYLPNGHEHKEREIGSEPTPAEFVQTMVRVFREVRRVLRDDGTLWLNLGDSYAGSGKAAGDTTTLNKGALASRGLNPYQVPQGMKPKDLMMIPARVAIALQDDGWYLRSDIAWCKRAPMPESVTDRPTSAWEHIFLLTKKATYFYDADAVREQTNSESGWAKQRATGTAGRDMFPTSDRNDADTIDLYKDTGSRNQWNYWLLSPEPFPAAHFATFPTEIPRRAILAGTSEHGCCAECGAPWRRVVERGDDMIAGHGTSHKRVNTPGSLLNGTSVFATNTKHTYSTTGWAATCPHNAPVVPCTVLDPFSGAGTTLLVANRLGRRGIGIELNPEYVEMARKRIISDAPLFAWADGDVA